MRRSGHCGVASGRLVNWLTKGVATRTVTKVTEVGVHEAKTHLSRLLRQVEAGGEVVIVRDGTPVARLVPVPPSGTRVFGLDEGRFTVPDDFDAPLPPEIQQYFE